MIKLYICFFISILIHELAHLLIAKIFKIKLKNLRVSLFGASLQIERNIKNKFAYKVFTYLAGPISNLLLAIIILKLRNEKSLNLLMIYTNISLFIFNLLPITPLDGGNILLEILKLKFNNLKAHKISLILNKICLGVLTFIYSITIIRIKNISFLFLLIYLWYLSFIEERKVELLERTYNALRKNLGTDT